MPSERLARLPGILILIILALLAACRANLPQAYAVQQDGAAAQQVGAAPQALTPTQVEAPTTAPTLDPRQPLVFRGSAPAMETLAWSGPGILHISVAGPSAALVVTLTRGLERVELVNAPGPLDEYRAINFDSTGSASLSVEGQGASAGWEITLLPPDRRHFETLNVPGNYTGSGSAVILIEGKYGVATFDLDRTPTLTAWAFGPRTGEKLTITPEGRYKGKSVLPRGAGWLVVSAQGPWSVEIQAPCCDAGPGY